MEQKSKEQIIKERQLRNNGFVYQDFLDSFKKLKVIGVVYVLIGLIYIATYFLFEASSLYNGLVSIVVGIFFFILTGLMDWHIRLNIIIALVVGLFLILAEFLLLGFPDRIVPGLGEFPDRKIINTFTIANDFSPIFYYVLKIGLLFPFLLILHHYLKVNKIPEQIKKELNIKLR